MHVELELFASDEHIEGRLHAPGRGPVEFSGVLGLLHAIEDLDLEPPLGENVHLHAGGDSGE